MTHKLLLSLLLASLSLSACAQSSMPDSPAKAGDTAKPAAAATDAQEPGYPPGTPESVAREAIRTLNPNAKVESVDKAPIPGFRQAIVAGQVIYISDDGKYLMQGTLFDIEAKQNLGEAALAKLRRQLIDSVPASDRIVFAPQDPKYHVVVFTDVECGYCRKLHNEMAEYNKQGIAVEYLAFPRMGLASEDFRKMESVWCAKDRNKALTDAKNDRKVAESRCKSPVAMQYALGQRAGLTGTPMILAEDGTQLGGYVPPEALRAALEEHAGAKPAGAKPAAEAPKTASTDA